MNDQPEPTDDQATSVDRSHLADLYPAAKSFEQRLADRKLADKRRRDRLPKNMTWTTIWRLYGILVAVFAGIHVGVVMFSVMGPLGAVPMSFLAGLAVLAYVYWAVSSTVRDFHGFGYRAGPFIATYMVAYPACLYWLTMLVDASTQRLEFVVWASVVHWLLVYVLMKLVGVRS